MPLGRVRQSLTFYVGEYVSLVILKVSLLQICKITNLSIKINQENKIFTEQRLVFVKSEAIMACCLNRHCWYLPDHSFFSLPEEWSEAEVSCFPWRPSTFTQSSDTKNGLCTLRTSEGLAEAKFKKYK